MKKIYLKPETVETKVELQQMIAGSPLTGEGTYSLTESVEGDENEEADSRYFSDWD